MRRISFRLTALLFALTALAFTQTAQQSKPTGATAAQNASTSPILPKLFEQDISYWTAEPGWHTEVMLRNNIAASPLTVYPSVRAIDGTETALRPVTIASGDVQMVDVNDELAKAATTVPSPSSAFGSIVVRYQSLYMRNLFASVMVHDTGHPIVFHLDASTEIKTPVTLTREGIWWLPTSQVKDYLIIANQSDHGISGKLLLYDSAGKSSSTSLALGPRQMQRFSVRELVTKAGLQGSYGGIKITMGDGGGALDSAYLLFDETSGFSANMKMFDAYPNVTMAERDYNGSGIWTTRAPMLALATPDPALALPSGTALQPFLLIRNTQNHPAQVKLSFHWHGSAEDGRYAMQPFRLAAFQTRLIDVAALQSQGSISTAANWAQVTLTTDGKPDEVMAVAASYDSNLRYGAQTPFSDQLSVHMEGTQWRVDPTHNSIMAVGNGGTKPVTAGITLFYDQGTKRYEMEKKIEPDSQVWVNFADLIQSRIPDKDGNVLPSDTKSGTYSIRVISHPWQAALYEGKVITDKTYGNATYGCIICCGYSAGGESFDPDPAYGTVNATTTTNVQATNSCTNIPEIIDDFYPDWYPSNASIFTMATGSMTGVSPGSGTMHASTTTLPGGGQGIDRPPYCPQLVSAPQAPGNVTPSLSSISPPQGLVGTGIDVTITGKGFSSGATVNAGANITVSNVNVSSSTQITATFTPKNSSSAGGNQGVTVSVPGSQPSNSVNFYVQVPTGSAITETLVSHALSSGASPCATGQAGWYRQVQKIVTDQGGSNVVVAGQNLNEIITIGTPNNLNITGTQTGTATTDANGNFDDTFYVCSAQCPSSSGQTDATQAISDVPPPGGGPYNLSPNSLVYECTGITVNGK